MKRRCRTCKFSPCRCADLKEAFDGGLPFHKASWPLLSDAAGVHPKQIADAVKEAEQLGTHISYTKDGRAIFESHQHRKEYMKALGLTDTSHENTMPKVKTMSERSI